MTNTHDYYDFIKVILSKYAPMGEQSLSYLNSIAKTNFLKKGQQLLDIGKTSKHIHILYEGVIVSCYLNSDGHTYNKNIFLEGDFVASTVSSIKNEPSNFALKVIEDAMLISFDYKKYRQGIEAHEDLKNFYIAYLEKNWVIDKEKREIEIVLKDSKSRYIDFIDKHPNIENRIPLHYIASHLGITPTQLSRIRKNLKKNVRRQHM